MPIRKITETDITGDVQVTSASNTVYIPGKAIDTDNGVAPRLFKTAAEFDAEKVYVDDLSHKLAKRLLKLGMYVLYEGCKVPSAAGDKETATVEYKMEKAVAGDNVSWSFKIGEITYTVDNNQVAWNDGTAKTKPITEGVAKISDDLSMTFDFINGKVSCAKKISPSTDITIDWARLQNKTLYNVRFLTTGGYACPSSGMIACAESRGDCIALIDHAEAETKPEKGKTVVGKVRERMEQFKSEFAAGFTPWFKTRNDVLGGSSEKEVSIPASFGYLFAYAKSIKNNPSWLPVAGAARGIIDDLTGVDYEYSEAEINALQKRVGLDEDGDNVGIAINPIAYMGESFGYLIWGNRTLSNNDAAKGLQAKSFLNVRNLVCELKKQIEAASLKYTFEPNNDVLWINWQAYLIPTLNRMESGAGILGYKLIREKTTAKARLKARIVIVPIEGVEDFEINVLMSDSLDITE